MKTNIKNWNEDDRPREKLLHKGAATLSDAELIAILIGSGTRTMTAVDVAREILQHADNSLDFLGKLEAMELSRRIKGIGTAKAVSIVAAMELGRRRKANSAPDSLPVTSSAHAAEIFGPMLEDLGKEEFWMLMLNNANKTIGKTKLSEGGLTSTVVDVRIAMKQAILNNATAIMVCHNHPSGVCRPSNGDIDVTRKFAQAASCMDIRFLDHIIICGKGQYFSFADENMI